MLLCLVQKFREVKFSSFIAINLLFYLYNPPLNAQNNIERRIDSVFKNNQEDFKNTIRLLNGISTNNTKGLAAKYHRIGTCYFKLNENQSEKHTQESAQKYLKKAEQILLKEKDVERLAKVYYNLGMLFKATNNRKEAITNFTSSINYFGSSQDKSDSYNYIADIYLENTQYKEALYNAKKALQLASETSESMANALITNGNIFLQVEQPDSAKFYFIKATNFPSVQKKAYRNLGVIEHIRKKYEDAVALYLNGKDDEDIQNVYTNLADAYLQIENYKKAKKYLDKAKANANTNELLANTYDNFTIYYLAQNNLSLASKSSDKALELITKTNPTLRSEILINKLEILKQRGYLKEGLRIAYEIDSLADNVRKIQSDDGSKILWRKKIVAFYNTALAVCYELKDKENAYYFMEKSRAVVLQEALRKASIGNKSTSSQVLGLKQLQSKLAANQTFVSYFAGDSAIYAFRVDAKRYDFQKLDISRSRYDTLSQSFLQKCSSQVLNKDFVGIAKELYDSLFAPLDIPAGQRVIISTNHTFLPFSALIDKTGKYLVHNHAFSYAFSASLLFPPTKTNKPKASYQLLAVQPHIFQNGLPTLADTNNSINEIRKIGYWGRKYFEVDATKDNLLPAMAKAKIIYFFTHATGNEQESKVYLRNEALNLEDIYAQQGKIAADLVCFAACQTALGKTESGEGVMSLARAFAYAGVPSMLSTLWNVNSGYTGSIYTYFFKNMSDDATKDIALQAAQIRFLNEPDTKNPDKTLPTNWAGLVVLGDTANIDNAMPPANTLLTIALCLVFAGFLWWWRK